MYTLILTNSELAGIGELYEQNRTQRRVYNPAKRLKAMNFLSEAS